MMQLSSFNYKVTLQEASIKMMNGRHSFPSLALPSSLLISMARPFHYNLRESEVNTQQLCRIQCANNSSQSLTHITVLE